MPMVNPRPFLDLLAATVDLAKARSVLRELIRLTNRRPGSPRNSCGFGCSRWPRTPHLGHPLSPRSPAGRRSNQAPDSAPGGQPAPHDMVQSAP